jgi:hypothetical protein
MRTGTRSHSRRLALPALLAIALAGLAGAVWADDRSTTFRRYDSQGRFAGTARHTDAGALRFYDARGRFAGTARRQPDGSWRSWNAKGEFTGTIRKRR